MISVSVLFFGPAREPAGCASARLEISADATAGGLRPLLAERFAGLARGLPAMRFAVNRTFVNDGHRLQDGDEVAVIPPVSGG